MELIITSIAAIITGIVIGICSGMLGIGGGTIMVPVYRLLFGMTALSSTATSLFTIIPTSLSGAAAHIRNKTCHLPLGLVLGIGGACTSPFGVWLATRSPEWLVMVVAACIIGYSAIDMFIKAMRMKTAPPVADTDSSDDVKLMLKRNHIIGGVLIGLIAGLASGYIGVGGGFIMVPLMLTFLGLPLKHASGTSLIAIIVLAIPGVITQGVLGNIDYLIGIITAVGSIPGAFIGAALASKIPERTLRFIFSAFLIVAALLLALNEFHVIG